MKKLFKLTCLAMSAFLLLGVLSGCAGSNDGGTVTLKVYNWGEYVDPDVLEQFTAETGIKISYSTFNDNESMFTKVKNAGDNSYDVVFPSDYMVAQMIENDMLAPLNFDNIPNASYTEKQFLNPVYDPENKYSVPYLLDMPGILYNTDYVDEDITSLRCLFDEKYAGKVCMLDSMRDTIGLTLKMLGYSMNDTDSAHINEAKDLLIKQKPNVLAYGTDDLAGKVMSGTAALAVVYSGEGRYAASEADNLKFVIPEEGTNVAIDNMVILKTSKHQAEAEQFINFMSRPEISLKNAQYTYYQTINSGAKELMSEEEKSDASALPAIDMESGKFEYFTSSNEPYVEAWTEIKASK